MRRHRPFPIVFPAVGAALVLALALGTAPAHAPGAAAAKTGAGTGETDAGATVTQSGAPKATETRPDGSAQPQTVAVTFLHVNDTHGRLEAAGRTGGYARLATLVRELRAKSTSARVFLVHAGDVLSRGDPLTRATLGAANVRLMNHLGFDIWTPGNGEFYDGYPVLAARIREARCRVLAANVRVRLLGNPIAEDTVVLAAGPVRVGFFGLCFVRTKHPSAVPLSVADPVATARRAVAELRAAGVDLVVAVTHLGVKQDTALARQVPGLDLILGGHSHTPLPAGRRVKDPAGREVLVCQAGQYLERLGVVKVVLERAAARGATAGAASDATVTAAGPTPRWRVAHANAQLLSITRRTRPDAEVEALIARMKREAGLTAPPTDGEPAAEADAAPAPRAETEPSPEPETETDAEAAPSTEGAAEATEPAAPAAPTP